ncbi:MAG: ABC-type transport auxiliary lipoprotein family protein [Gammaproteobacteria bacterium]
MKSLLLSILFILVLSACSISGEPVPQDHFYRLPQVNIETRNTSVLDSLQLVSVTADGLYNERNLLYVDASRPLEVGRYHYHYWVESPLTLVAKYLAEAIKTSNVAMQFTGPKDKASVNARMSIQIVRFERIIDDSGYSVRVGLLVDMDYRQANPGHWQKLYQLDQAVDSSDMQDSVRAFGEALNSISRMLIKDLGNP